MSTINNDAMEKSSTTANEQMIGSPLSTATIAGVVGSGVALCLCVVVIVVVALVVKSRYFVVLCVGFCERLECCVFLFCGRSSSQHTETNPIYAKSSSSTTTTTATDSKQQATSYTSMPYSDGIDANVGKSSKKTSKAPVRDIGYQIGDIDV
jgi:hypothetical protein